MDNTSPKMSMSQLRPPSKIPASIYTRPLNDITEYENNARAQMPPPSSISGSLKHKLDSKLPEPASKRKTLMERAGEIQANAVHPPLNPRQNNGTLPSLHARSKSSATLRSQASNGQIPRPPSGSSIFNGSVGPMSRPQSAQNNHRPQSVTSHSRTAFHAANAAVRPQSLVQQHANVDTFSNSSSHKAPFDPTSRFEAFEQNLKQMYAPMERIEQSLSDRHALQEQVTVQKSKIQEQEARLAKLEATNDSLHLSKEGLQIRNYKLEESKEALQSQMEELRDQLRDLSRDLEEVDRRHKIELEDLQRKHRIDSEDTQEELRKQSERLRREAEDKAGSVERAHREELADLERRLRREIDEEQTRALREVADANQRIASIQASSEQSRIERDEQARESRIRTETALEHERMLRQDLQQKLTESTTTNVKLEAAMTTMRAKIDFLESGNQAQSQEFANLKRREQEAIATAQNAIAKLRAEETLRRKLHNQVQELKGNIRVFCRVRPALGDEEGLATINFPDDGEDPKDVVVMGPEQKSALGNITRSKNAFSFDRVFSPSSRNPEVFEEISQLVQSALDGYNVCIFCYGQTSSGKTFTMSANDGMIPLAVQQIYETAENLKEKGWTYTMEGSFVEIYNENLNDLLGSAEDLDKKKLEIRHDPVKGKTAITDANTVALDSPEALNALLKRAQKNRTVAATKANERSSRSHSVFMLSLTGSNAITGEKSEGTLNLVDLAGSERLAHSGATGDRLKETQNINKSLSSLGDVISALGQGKDGAHIPFRNSKLTYLLKESLGGNSKTLMFVMCSPLEAHLSETLTSLKFATKVHNTHIGSAKRQVKV